MPVSIHICFNGPEGQGWRDSCKAKAVFVPKKLQVAPVSYLHETQTCISYQKHLFTLLHSLQLHYFIFTFLYSLQKTSMYSFHCEVILNQKCA